MKNYHFLAEVDVAGVHCIVSRTGYTGEDGFEIYCKNREASKLWDAVWEAGQKHELNPAGLGARDVLRLEAAMPLYGHELSRELTPLMPALIVLSLLIKRCPLTDRKPLKKQKAEGLKKKLFGLEMLERGVPREGYPVKGW
jgi:aminomethyltransferase